MLRHDILYAPSYAMVRVTLSPGQRVFAEAGAMVGMSPDMGVRTLLSPSQVSAEGFWGRLFALLTGLLVALLRKALGGETLFVNSFEPGPAGGEVLLAPTLTGDIVHHRLENDGGLLVQSGAYLASSAGVRLRPRFGGLRGLLSGKGLFFLEIQGKGDLWLNAFGGIEVLEVHDSLTVDTGHIVAFEPALSWRVATIGGLKSTLLSGEGLVMRFSGKGRVWVQSRNLEGFARWVRPMLPH